MIEKVKRRETVEEALRLLLGGTCEKANVRRKQQIENTSKRDRWKLGSRIKMKKRSHKLRKRRRSEKHQWILEFKGYMLK